MTAFSVRVKIIFHQAVNRIMSFNERKFKGRRFLLINLQFQKFARQQLARAVVIYF